MTIQVQLPAVPTVGLAIPGIQGPPGAGAAVTVTGTAAVAISANQAVSASASGFAPTNPDDDASVAACVGIALTSALPGAFVDVLISGTITQATGWNFPIGPLYCGANGLPVPTPPTASAVLQIATACTQDTIAVRVHLPILQE